MATDKNEEATIDILTRFGGWIADIPVHKKHKFFATFILIMIIGSLLT